MIGILKIAIRFAACLAVVLLSAIDFTHGDDLQLIGCGADEVFLIDPADPKEKKWSWRAEDSPSIPEGLRGTFRSTDDCKPYEEDLILITSSSDGVALIERHTKKCLFLAQSRNAHSACLLPNSQVAVAASSGGDRIEFHDLADERKPAIAQQTIPLPSAHGALWDQKRNCLWALGGSELLRLVSDEKARPAERWSVKARHALPTGGGHDLSEAHDGKRLFVTTNTQVLLFDRDAAAFQAHAKLGELPKVKSVDVHPVTKRIVFHQASKEHWWSDTVRFTDDDPLRLDGERLYKIRWDVSAQRP